MQIVVLLNIHCNSEWEDSINFNLHFDGGVIRKYMHYHNGACVARQSRPVDTELADYFNPNILVTSLAENQLLISSLHPLYGRSLINDHLPMSTSSDNSILDSDQTYIMGLV